LGPVLLFVPVATGKVRTVVVALFLGFHLVGLNLSIELGPFPYICAVAWLALIPGWFWDTLGRRFPGLAKPAAAPDPQRRPCLIQPAWWVNVATGGLLAYVLTWNLGTVYHDAYNFCVPPESTWGQWYNGIGNALQ